MKDAGDKTGRSYETLVQEIFQTIHDQEAVPNISVERNVILQGKFTEHQIDVYWKFLKGGVPYETIVQAKDWASPVKKGQLLEFKSVLDDLPGQPRGIFVSKGGYQRGARQVAAAHGIILYELREAVDHPTPTEVITSRAWVRFEVQVKPVRAPRNVEGVVKRGEVAVGLGLTAFQPHVSNVQFQIDKAWFDQNPLTKKIDESCPEPKSLPMPDIALYDASCNPITDLEKIVIQELELIREEGLDNKHVVHAFGSETFIGPELTGSSYLKANSVSFDVKIQTTHVPVRFDLTKFVQFVLREISSGETQTFVRPRKNNIEVAREYFGGIHVSGQTMLASAVGTLVPLIPI